MTITNFEEPMDSEFYVKMSKERQEVNSKKNEMIITI